MGRLIRHCLPMMLPSLRSGLETGQSQITKYPSQISQAFVLLYQEHYLFVKCTYFRKFNVQYSGIWKLSHWLEICSWRPITWLGLLGHAPNNSYKMNISNLNEAIDNPTSRPLLTRRLLTCMVCFTPGHAPCVGDKWEMSPASRGSCPQLW